MNKYPPQLLGLRGGGPDTLVPSQRGWEQTGRDVSAVGREKARRTKSDTTSPSGEPTPPNGEKGSWGF